MGTGSALHSTPAAAAGTAGPEALAPFVAADWSGQVPALVVFDRAGQRVATCYGDTALDKVAKHVRELAQE